MDDKRNGFDSLSRRDKRRQQVASRLHKLDAMFISERDHFYKASLQKLQNALATLQQGTNEDFLQKKTNLEEERDYELTRLRLWEEYRVKRIDNEYKEDLQRAKENRDRMIKLIKEKLYDKLQRQIKQLKEDKLLLNLVNSNSYNSSNLNNSAVAAINNATSLNDRRSLRKRELHSRFGPSEMDDLSDGPSGSSTAAELLSAAGYGSMLSSNVKRRRHYATRYSSNDEANGNSSAHTKNPNHSAISSGNESNLSEKDYDTLNSMIMGNEVNGMSLVMLSSNQRPARGSHKQFIGPQGLKSEELQEDLNMIRSAVSKENKT